MTIDDQLRLIGGAIKTLISKDMDTSELASVRDSIIAKKREGIEVSQPVPDAIQEHLDNEYRRRSEREFKRSIETGQRDREREHIDDLQRQLERKKGELAKAESDYRRSGNPTYVSVARPIRAEVKRLESELQAIESAHAAERDAIDQPPRPDRTPTADELTQLESMRSEISELAAFVRRNPADTYAKSRWSRANREAKQFAADIGAAD